VTWHFKTEPKPSNLENIIIWGVLSVIAVATLYRVIDFIKTWWLERTRKEEK
jgi:predicted membrane channel-forming protein YqfA (hemolysin III family)